MDIRADEDRAHQQIDQARLEAKALQQRLELEQREHDKRVTQLITQNEELQVAMRTAEHAATHQAGQVAALEATLNRWRRLSAPSKRKADKSSTQAKPKRPSSRAGKHVADCWSKSEAVCRQLGYLERRSPRRS
jgi:septal ring factor EnvC (AmiA/AmiB activator)